MLFTPIALTLNGVLEKNDTYLPLSQADTNRLLSIITEGEEMYLTLQDNLYTEWVRAYNDCGTVLIERGIDCEARKFPKGTCVFFETSLPVIKWLICNYDCCQDGDCDCIAVALEESVLPAGIVNYLWTGKLTFSGTLPLNINVTAPDWVTVEILNGEVSLSGTPSETGIQEITYSATNCRGSVLISGTLSFQIFEVSVEEDDTDGES